VGYAVSYPHPLYPLGGDFFPFAYLWVQISYHTLTLMGKNPLGKRVVGTHGHQEEGATMKLTIMQLIWSRVKIS
jgi:hypothetical protein